MTLEESNSKSLITFSNSRLDKIQSLILKELEERREIPRDQPFKWSLTHVISCSQIIKLLATARGLDVEIAAIAGAVHDLAIIRTGKFADHGPLGAPMVKEFLLNYNNLYGKEHGLISDKDIELIVQATHNHTYKKEYSEVKFDELIKDADSLDRYLHVK